MITCKDKMYIEELNKTHPDICSFFNGILLETKQNIKKGCHDIVNLLSLVYGHIQLFELTHPELASDSRWSIINDSIRQLNDMMKAISAYRYADTASLSYGSISLTVKQILNGYSSGSSLNIIYEIPEKLPDVFYNPDNLRYILSALLDNISDIDACADAVIQISDTPEYVLLKVSDSLEGLSTDVMHDLFRPFNSSKQFHSGMSLATAYRMSVAQGGTLYYEKSAAGGSCFTLSMKK